MNPIFGLFQKALGPKLDKFQGTPIGKMMAPLFAKLAKKRSASRSSAQEQPEGTMKPGYEASSRNTTLLS